MADTKKGLWRDRAEFYRTASQWLSVIYGLT